MDRVRVVPRLGRAGCLPGASKHSRGVSQSRHALEVVRQADEGVLGTDGAAGYRRVLAIRVFGGARTGGPTRLENQTEPFFVFHRICVTFGTRRRYDQLVRLRCFFRS